jgi:hypothetical protein
MKKLALFIISILLVTCVYAGSPTISVKSKKQIRLTDFAYELEKSFNTLTGETLVIWLQNDGRLIGALISPKGKLVGKAFLLVNNLMFGASIAFNPSTQEYFVAYGPFDRSIVPYGSIFAVRLDQHGKRIGNEITVVEGVKPEKPNDLGDNAFPHLIFNPKTNGYIMIWERTEGIAAALLDKDGKLTSPIQIVKKNPGPNGYYDDQRSWHGRIYDVEWLAPANKLLVVFGQRFTDQPPGGTGGQADDFLAVLDPLLQRQAKVSKINTDPLFLGIGGSGLAVLGILPDGSACVFFADNEIVKGRTINSKGKFTSALFPAFSGPVDAPLYDSTVALSTTNLGTVGLLMAYRGTPSGVAGQNFYAQVIDGHGRPIGDPQKIEDHTQVEGFQSLLFALPRKQTDTRFEYIWLQSRFGNNSGPCTILKLKLQVTP